MYLESKKISEKYLFEVTINGHTTFIVESETAMEALKAISPKYHTSSIKVRIIDPSSPVLICE